MINFGPHMFGSLGESIIYSVGGTIRKLALTPVIKPLVNIIGDFLEYDRCPVTKDSYLITEDWPIPYAHDKNVFVSVKTFKKRFQKKVSLEEIVKRFKKRGKSEYPNSVPYEDEEIISYIDNGKIPTILEKNSNIVNTP